VNVAECLERFAMLAQRSGAPRWAAELFGVAAVLREEVTLPLPPSARAEYEHALKCARAALGEEAFAVAWAEGRAMSLEDAVARLLEPDGADDRGRSAVPE
jgi:hypothetical protein